MRGDNKTMASKKGSFIEANKPATATPASQLLAKANNTTVASEDKETKSVRLNLLIKPSTKKDLEKLATVDRTSINDLINRALEEYITTRAEDVAKYNSFYGEE